MGAENAQKVKPRGLLLSYALHATPAVVRLCQKVAQPLDQAKLFPFPLFIPPWLGPKGDKETGLSKKQAYLGYLGPRNWHGNRQHGAPKGRCQAPDP